MELKFIKQRGSKRVSQSLNRTFMELKSIKFDMRFVWNKV